MKEIEGPIGRLRPQYLHKLRFITNTTITNTEPADTETQTRENGNDNSAGSGRF